MFASPLFLLESGDGVFDAMDFGLDKQQAEMIAVFKAFGEATFTPENVAQWCRDQGLPDEVVKEFAELYFSFDNLSDEHKLRHSIMTQTLILEELSRCAGATLPFQNELFNIQIMGGFADEVVFHRVIENYRSTGRLMFSLGVSEPNAGSDSMSMTTNVQTCDGILYLNGQKTYVNNGEYAPSILVAAIDRDQQKPSKYPPLTFWLIPSNLPGIRAIPIDKMGQSMVPFASLSFDDVPLKPEWRLRGNNGGFKQLFQLLECGRVFTCASCLGMVQAAMEDATRYAKNRTAFGRPIAQFQQIEQMLTDMEISLTTMRSMLYQAAWDIKHDRPEKRLSVALMKRYIPKTATEVASNAMQILGGQGYTESARAARIWEDCRGNQIAEGTDQIMVYIAAPLIMEKYCKN